MLYIFDLDGTLVDSLEDLKEATEYALATMGYPGHDEEDYRYFVGNGVKKLLHRAFGTEDEDVYQKARQLFDEYYQEHCLDHTKPYTGLAELLEALKAHGHYIGVVTNKPHPLAKKITDACFNQRLDFCYGQIDGIEVKPNPYFALQVRNEYQISNDQCFFIGDSNVDIETGKNASMKTIGVTWGNRSYEELKDARATYIVSTVNELRTLLLGEGK